MPGLIVLESMWNKKGGLLEDEPSVLPYLKAIRQSLAWEGIRVNLVYRRFYSNYDLGLLLEEIRRRRVLPDLLHRLPWPAAQARGHRQPGHPPREPHRPLPAEPALGYIFGACDFVDPATAQNFLLATGARFVAGYQKPIPWTESMLVDCLFLSYLLGGTMKWIRTKHGERIPPLRATRGLRDHALREPAEGDRASSTGTSRSPTTSRSRCSRWTGGGAAAGARQLLRRVSPRVDRTRAA